MCQSEAVDSQSFNVLALRICHVLSDIPLIQAARGARLALLDIPEQPDGGARFGGRRDWESKGVWDQLARSVLVQLVRHACAYASIVRAVKARSHGLSGTT